MTTSAAPEIDLGYRTSLGEPTVPNVKQRLAHASSAYELLYGGGVFGGKTDFLIMEAIRVAVLVPGCQVAFGRQKLKELTSTVLQRFRELMPMLPDGSPFFSWNGSEHRFTGINDSEIQFVFCHADADLASYASAQWLLLCIDQVEDFQESWYRYFLQRVRSRFPGVPPRVRLSANPKGGWLKRRFVRPTPEDLLGQDPPQPGDVWCPAEAVDPSFTRQFIQAFAAENLEGLKTDPKYMARIQASQTAREFRRLSGDWDAWDGQLFEAWAASHYVGATDQALLERGVPEGTVLPWHVIPDPHWTPLDGAVVYLSVDYGYGNPWAAYATAFLSDEHCVTFHEWYATGVQDVVQAQRIADWVRDQRDQQQRMGRMPWRVAELIGDLPSGDRREMGLVESVFEVYDNALAHVGVQVRKSTNKPGSRKAGLQRVLGALECADDGFPHWQVTTACPNLIRTLPDLPQSETNLDDVDTDAEDHAYDAMKVLFLARPAGPKGADWPGASTEWPGRKVQTQATKPLRIDQFRLGR